MKYIKKGYNPWNKGKKMPKRIKDKISNTMKKKLPQYSFKKGNIPWNKGRKGYSIFPNGRKFTEKHIKNLSDSHKGKISPLKGRKRPKEVIIKCLKRNPKSSLEIKFEDIIKQLGLPYKFVGNGEVIVARKCPDFVNSNGEKIAVEVYYRKHKELFRNGLEVWKAERTKIFNENGWKIIFFDETQVNKEIIKEVLKW